MAELPTFQATSINPRESQVREEAPLPHSQSNQAERGDELQESIRIRKRRVRMHTEHRKGGGSEYVKAIVFGGLDGIVTTFATAAAAAGSGENYQVVLVFGFASVFADAWSMGFGEFISGRAERDYAISERQREEWEVENCLESEKDEMMQLYLAKGISRADCKTLVDIISKDPNVFVDFMMVDELQILCDVGDEWHSAKQGAVMYCSFVVFGTVALLPYLFGKGEGTDYIFGLSIVLTALAMVILGGIKGKLTEMSILASSGIMLLNGCISGGVAYGAAALVETIVKASTT